MLAIVDMLAQGALHIDVYAESPWYEALKACYDKPQGIEISAFAMIIEGKFPPRTDGSARLTGIPITWDSIF